MKTLLFLLAISYQLSAISQTTKQITATGHAYITADISPNQAQKQALQDARVNALKAAGVPVNVISEQNQSTQQDFQLSTFNSQFSDQTKTDIAGSLLHDSIISDSIYIDAMQRIVCQVTIKAEVQPILPKEVLNPIPNTQYPVTYIHYDGTISGNCDNGYGTEQYYNGDTYIGNWKNGKRNGYGYYRWANGLRFNGYWINGFQQDGKRNCQTQSNVTASNSALNTQHSKLDSDADNFSKEVEIAKQKIKQ